ncbi:MAG TPA: Fur family transcriptional regulator [Solirubrobacterales bacterium]
MAAATDTAWAKHAHETLRAAGLRRGGARTAVIEALARQSCAISALQLDDELRARQPRVGRASIYRALEQFEQLGLVQRIEMTRGTAGYERIEPDGHHHHHAVCRNCGKLETFEDSKLEQAIGRVSEEISFEISEHDVVLRGLCGECAR